MNGRASKREILVGGGRRRGDRRPARPAGAGRRRPGLPRPAADDRRRLPRRPGDPRRQPGADRRASTPGRVVDIDLTEVEGTLRARVRISLPDDLAKKLQAGRQGHDPVEPDRPEPGQHRLVGPVERRRCVPAQVVQGVESTFFDPILEQVGLGPGRAEPPQPHDRRGPPDGRRRRPAGPADPRHAPGDRQRRPRVGRHDPARRRGDRRRTSRTCSKRIAAATPKIEATLARLDSLTAAGRRPARREPRQPPGDPRQRPRPDGDAQGRRRSRTGPRSSGCSTASTVTRARADRVLYQADLIAGQGVADPHPEPGRHRADGGQRQDATDWADKLVQKIYANPFVLSPFYKPTPEDIRVQTVYDTAQVFTKGAQELNDAVKTLEAMQAQAPDARAAAGDRPARAADHARDRTARPDVAAPGRGA